jgi:acyl-CoA dehydrogenase
VQVNGSIGVSAEMPFMDMLSDGLTIGIADGPTEVHDVTLARDILKGYKPVEGLFPSRHTLTRRRAAEEKYADALATVSAERA